MNVDNLLESRHFCILPFIRQTLWYDGTFKLCCYAGGTELEKADSNVNAFNTDQLKKIRQTFLNNKFPSECSGCKNLVDAGLTAPAQFETQGWIGDPDKRALVDSTLADASLDHDLTPQMLDIRYSNVCNLKCRTCNPYNSSAIQAEYNKLVKVYNISKFHSGQIKQKYKHVFSNIDHNLSRIYFAGGEPLVEEYNLEFLKTYTNTDTEIIINTNLTVLTNEVIELFKKFRHIILNVSIDGVGEVNDYIRYGSNFSTIQKNLNRVQEFNNIRVTVCYVLNMYNIFNTLDTILFLKNNYPQLLLNLSIQKVCDEKELFLECLPPELRPEAIAVLTQSIVESPKNSSVLTDSIKLLESSNFNLDEFKNFIRYSKILDQQRNQLLVDVVPQYQLYY